MKVKQTHAPLPTSSIKMFDCFELIHCDIWGGYKTASLTGAHYFLTTVDQQRSLGISYAVQV